MPTTRSAPHNPAPKSKLEPVTAHGFTMEERVMVERVAAIERRSVSNLAKHAILTFCESVLRNSRQHSAEE